MNHFPQQLSLAPMSEKALKCQRRVKESDSQPEPYPVGQRPLSPTRLKAPLRNTLPLRVIERSNVAHSVRCYRNPYIRHNARGDTL